MHPVGVARGGIPNARPRGGCPEVGSAEETGQHELRQDGTGPALLLRQDDPDEGPWQEVHVPVQPDRDSVSRKKEPQWGRRRGPTPRHERQGEIAHRSTVSLPVEPLGSALSIQGFGSAWFPHRGLSANTLTCSSPVHGSQNWKNQPERWVVVIIYCQCISHSPEAELP